MSSESSETCIDLTVEMLKKKYLNKRKLASKRNVNRGERVALDNMKCNETRIARTVESPLYGSIDHHRKRYDKALQELFQAVTNVPERLDRVGQWEHSQSLSEDEDEHSAEEAGYTSDTQNNINTETDVTLPSCLAKGSGSGGTGGSAPADRQQKRPSPQGSSLSAADISQVYQEMVHIYEKLQTERTHQQQWATRLQEWEERLRERESRLLRPRQEQEEAHGQVRGLQEQYQQDVQQLSEALKEKARENRRIKASFDSIKELNDTMRNQLNDVTEQNKKLESQSKKVQARLENLQRKYEYSMAHKGRESVLSKTQEPKPSKQDKPSLPAKPSKASTSPGGVKLLVLLLDWVTDCHLVSGQGDGPGQGAQQALPLYTGSVQERCSKVLPMLTEQLQLVPAVDKGLLIPLLKFIYLSLKQLDNSPQQLTLTSTMRRLGEEVYRGSGPQGGAFDAPVSTRTKASPLFKSPCLHTRFLSTLIILSTISQADILAQALDSLHDDLRSEEGRELFLQYRALPVVLAHLRGGGRGLLGVSIDILLQMAGESRLLNSFLEACSTEDFFRCIATLLRNPRLDISLVEKASIILQKLSKIRKNKRLFELCSIHLMVQEMHRTVDPTHAFLAINLNSILFNLADILAQALDSLHDDLRSEEGRELFLQYRALPVVLAHLRGGGRGLLGVSIDILLQMAGESRLLNSFLEACSTEDFFRCIATLLRNPRLDISLVEKASIILQKLSKIRKNKRLFELCSIHLMVQEMHRTVDPTHAFLAINLNSILFNLGMMKRTPLCSSPADSP